MLSTVLWMRKADVRNEYYTEWLASARFPNYGSESLDEYAQHGMLIGDTPCRPDYRLKTPVAVCWWFRFVATGSAGIDSQPTRLRHPPSAVSVRKKYRHYRYTFPIPLNLRPVCNFVQRRRDGFFNGCCHRLSLKRALTWDQVPSLAVATEFRPETDMCSSYFTSSSLLGSGHPAKPDEADCSHRTETQLSWLTIMIVCLNSFNCYRLSSLFFLLFCHIVITVCACTFVTCT